ncbi:4Fe-4S cluster-binding domain-containing protein [bacterium]|nr:4Fe-4S cluster-binding domain-containing protein [bacterium]
MLLINKKIKKRINLVLKILIWYFKIGFKVVYIKFFHTIVPVKPYKLVLDMTNNCNFKCETCGVWRYNNKLHIDKVKLVDYFKNKSNRFYFLTITGGEPFMDLSYLTEIIKIAKENCPNLYYISINTNGYFTKNIISLINDSLNDYNFLKIYLGISYIPNQEWGFKKTGVDDSFKKLHKTHDALADIKKIFRKRLSIYNIITINTLKDYDQIKNKNLEDELWINFAEKGNKYNNNDFTNLDKLSQKEKLFIINDFYVKNQNSLSLLNRRYLLVMKKILINGERSLYCFAGINRTLIDYNFNEYICIKELRNRSEMKFNYSCQNCWTPCEATFDIIQNLSVLPN